MFLSHFNYFSSRFMHLCSTFSLPMLFAIEGFSTLHTLLTASPFPWTYFYFNTSLLQLKALPSLFDASYLLRTPLHCPLALLRRLLTPFHWVWCSSMLLWRPLSFFLCPLTPSCRSLVPLHHHLNHFRHPHAYLTPMHSPFLKRLPINL